jgi:hypothetical protein
MTALNRNPRNTNFLQPTKYLLTFDRISDVQYQCQAVNLPGVSLGVVTRETPFIDMYSPGTKLTYNGLDITFYIDEELTSWKNLQNWFLSIANPDGFESRDHSRELRTQGLKHFSDATLTILSNLNNPLVRIKFANVFPTNLGDLNFDTQLSADTIMSATASFKYDFYTIESA